VSVTLSSDRRKEMTVNGLPAQRNSDLKELFFTVLFEPDHLGLVKEGPEVRRKFLDEAVSQLRPKYQSALEDYQRIVTQKNMLLRQRPYWVEALLEVWNERLAEIGSYLTLQRGSYVRRLHACAAPHQEALSRGTELLELRYRGFPGSEEKGELITDLPTLRDRLRRALAEAMADEIERGSAQVGPHRDDMVIRIGGNPARVYASQGQQRSIVLALKLGECEIIGQVTGSQPVLLLDDVMSELDRTRQNYIRRSSGGRQVLITSCARPRMLKTAAAFAVEGGRITALSPDGETSGEAAVGAAVERDGAADSPGPNEKEASGDVSSSGT
ncbi:MAG: DNA replication and repair protein RecF, partial [Clostridia bacterium]|nr:DNA replication and repair protein RecF [Clostridia bacterium]